MSSTETERNKAICKCFHDAINSNDFDRIDMTIDELCTPDLVFHAPVPFGETGRQALKRVMSVLHQAYPDLHVAIEDVIAEGNKVVARNVVTGTNRGDYMGRPPTGRHVTYNEIFIFRCVDGRVAEIWGVVDVMAQMKQLGAIPA